MRALIGLDRVIHEPARLVITAILAAVDRADFLYLLRETGLTKGNLSTHLAKLEDAGYVEITKGFEGKRPFTLCRLTPAGVEAFTEYRRSVSRAVGHMGAD